MGFEDKYNPRGFDSKARMPWQPKPNFEIISVYMQEVVVEGIVLRSQDYRERQRIVTLFTPLGVLSFIVRSISSKRSHLLSLTTPFSHAEYHLMKKNSELLSFQDGVMLNEYLDLRVNLQSLKTAGALAQTILRTQWPGKASPSLFALYKAYHAHVIPIANWQALLASFYLKLLKLEGVMLSGSEEGVEGFSIAELDTLALLGGVQQFSALDSTCVSNFFLGKIEKLLMDLTH